MEIIENRS